MAGEMYAVSGETLTGIANAIRGKTGDDDFMTVSAFAEAIEGIPVSGLPAQISGIKCGVANIESDRQIITVQHDFGVFPTFCGIIALYDDWDDQPFGSCVRCTYTRTITTNQTSTENDYEYMYVFKHPTSGNELKGTYTLLKNEEFKQKFDFIRGSSDWRANDNNGNPINYLWFCLALIEEKMS